MHTVVLEMHRHKTYIDHSVANRKQRQSLSCAPLVPVFPSRSWRSIIIAVAYYQSKL